MIRIIILCLLFFPATAPALAQGKTKAEKDFLYELNRVLKQARTQHWAYEDSMSIEKPFRISETGMLSVTTRFHSAEGSYLVKMEASMTDISFPVHDIYIILETAGDDVQVYESEKGSNTLVLKYKRELFHIGYLEDDGQTLERLEKLLAAVKKYYPSNAPSPK